MLNNNWSPVLAAYVTPAAAFNKKTAEYYILLHQMSFNKQRARSSYFHFMGATVAAVSNQLHALSSMPQT